MIVQRGKHRFTPPVWGPVIGGISRRISFDPSCRYDLNSLDQQDWNKLIGVCGWRGPHHNSYRFAWRYNPQIDLIEIGAYWYQKGHRNYRKLGEIGFNREYEFKIIQRGGFVKWYMNGQLLNDIPGKIPYIGWKLGPYFGGNIPAPHKMKIEIY